MTNFICVVFILHFPYIMRADPDNIYFKFETAILPTGGGKFKDAKISTALDPCYHIMKVGG